MDFDSLKVTAKINSGSYEPKQDETPKISHEKASAAELKAKVFDNNSGSNNAQTANSKKENQTSENYLNKLSKAIDSANSSLKALMIKREFGYRIHEATGRLIVDVKDSETGEIIKEIPSEENLDMIAKMQELAGIIIDEKR